jgi:hypothetical protein
MMERRYTVSPAEVNMLAICAHRFYEEAVVAAESKIEQRFRQLHCGGNTYAGVVFLLACCLHKFGFLEKDLHSVLISIASEDRI